MSQGIAIRPTTDKRDVIHNTGSTWYIARPSEEDWATATGDLHTKFCADRFSSSRDMLVDRQTNLSQYPAPLPGRTGGVITVCKINSKNASQWNLSLMTNFCLLIMCQGTTQTSSFWSCARVQLRATTNACHVHSFLKERFYGKINANNV